MYPSLLEEEKRKHYYSESDCFLADPCNLVYAYPHPSYDYKMHSHQFYEINIITRGEGMHYVGNSSIPVKVGDVFILPPGVPHGYYSEKRLDVFHILLRSEFMRRYREELDGLPAFSLLFDIEPAIRRSSGAACHLNIKNEQQAQIFTEAERIVHAVTRREYVYANVLALAFIGRVGELLWHSIEGGGDGEDSELLLAMDYIGKNLGKKLTLDMISEVAKMSRATLNRKFDRALGISPMRYVMNCRLERARELLALGRYSKTEIANMTGFYDVAHLNKYLFYNK